MLNLKALGIVKDDKGKTVGAKFLNLQTGLTEYITTKAILKNIGSIKVVNAIIDKNGFIRSFTTHLETYTLIDGIYAYKINSYIFKKLPYVGLDICNIYINNALQVFRSKCLEISLGANRCKEVLIAINLVTLSFGISLGDYTRVVPAPYSTTHNIISKSQRNTVLVIHNHPNCSRLSSDDLQQLCRYDSIHSVEAIGNTGDIYRVIKLNNYNNKFARNFYNKSKNNKNNIPDAFFKNQVDLGLKFEFIAREAMEDEFQ